MYWNWVAIIRRESVIYLDSGSVCAKGELFEERSILCRCRNAGSQEDDDRAIKSWPGRLTDPAKVSVIRYLCFDVMCSPTVIRLAYQCRP